MATYLEEHVPAYRWVVLGTLTSGMVTAMTATFVIGLLLPDISRELGLSPSQQGWLGASMVFGNLILSIPINLWLSRYRPRRVVTLTFLGIGVFTLLQGWSPTLAILIAGRIALNICFVATQAPRALLIQQWSPASRLPLTQGIMFGAGTIVLGVAIILTPLLLDALGSWRNTLYIMGGMGILSTFLWTILGRERVTPEYQQRMESQVQSPLLTPLKYKQLWLMGLAMCSVSVAVTAYDVFWPTFAQEGLDVSLTIAGITVGIVLLVAGPTTFLVTGIPDLARRQTLVLGACGVAIFGTNLGLLYLDTIPTLLMMAVVRGVAFIFFPVLMIMVYQLPGIRPREVVVGVAIISTSAYLGAAIGPLLVGFVQEATGDLRLALHTTAFTPLLVVVAAAILHAQRSEPSTRARQA